MSAHTLRAKLARALQLDYGWRTAGALRAYRRMTANVKPRIMPDAFQADAFGRVEPLILPGGEYVLIENRGQLELWSVDPVTCLWVAPLPSFGRLDCTAFEFELQQHGSELVVAAAYIDTERSRT